MKFTAIDIEKKITLPKSKDNKKRAEKPYFHCGPPEEKAVKST